GVVPIAVEGMRAELYPLHLGIADADAGRVRCSVELGSDLQTRARFGRSNQVHDGLMAEERPSSPVHGDVREQAVFDLVPLAGAGWEMTDRHVESGNVCEVLQFEL